MKINVSSTEKHETLDNHTYVAQANRKILDTAFNLQNFILKELEKIHCVRDNEINILLFYDKHQNISWELQNNICDNCKSKLKEILEKPEPL